MQEYFIRKDVKYDLRTRDLLQIPAAKSTTFGIHSIKFRGSLLQNSIPDLIKRASSAATFKRNIKNWSGEECHCKISRQCLLIVYLVTYSSFRFLLYLVIYSSFIVNSWSELARISAM